MDQRNYSHHHEIDNGKVERSDNSSDFIDLDRLMTIARRHVVKVILCVVIALTMCIAYLIIAPRTYTAQTSILLDNNLAKYATDQTSPARQNAETDADVSSEIQILKSQQLALSVVDKLRLDKNTDFLNPPRSPTERLKQPVKNLIENLINSLALHEVRKQSRSAVDPARVTAAALLRQSLSVERSGRSFVLNVSYSADDPDFAASIANTYADAYMTDQLNANFNATQRATVWLQQRLTDLKANAQKASMAAARYKANNGLTLTRGQLVSEQQLSDLNSKLVLAQADLATASAQYRQYESIIEGGPANAVKNATVSSDTSDNSVIAKLKSQYLMVVNRANAVQAKFGKDHPQAVILRKQEKDLSTQIFHELQQLTNSYKNSYDIVKSRVESLQKSISQLTKKTSDANKSLVHLNNLKQRADALNTLYQSYLSRFEEASQQSSLPIAKARVISEAGVPTAPSSPKKKIALALSIVLGLMAGGALGALSELRERFFRTEDDVSDTLDLKFLGYLPDISERSLRKRKIPSDGENECLFNPIMRIAVDQPSSAYAETLRNVKLAADVVIDGGKCRVIGIISALQRDGKSTVAGNLAGLLAATGAKTLLVDGNLRHPGLSQQLIVSPNEGLVEAATSDIPWAKFIKVDRRSRLAFLPSVARQNFVHTSEFLSCCDMVDLLQGAREMFDYVVIDLPPSKAVIDAKTIEPSIDGFVAVAKWGKTPRAVLRSMLYNDAATRSKVLGVVLNKTDMKKLPRYVSPGAAERYINSYAAYYRDAG